MLSCYQRFIVIEWKKIKIPSVNVSPQREEDPLSVWNRLWGLGMIVDFI